MVLPHYTYALIEVMKIKNLKRYKRRILFASHFWHVFGWALLSPLYALYVTELGGDAKVAALIWSFYTLLCGVMYIALGWVEDRISQKEKILMVGYVLQTLGVGLLFMAGDLTLMIASYAVHAVGNGFVVPVWKQLFSRVEVRGREATEWGIFHGGNAILMSTAAAVSSGIFVIAGFKGILGLMVAAHIVSALIGLRLVKTLKA